MFKNVKMSSLAAEHHQNKSMEILTTKITLPPLNELISQLRVSCEGHIRGEFVGNVLKRLAFVFVVDDDDALNGKWDEIMTAEEAWDILNQPSFPFEIRHAIWAQLEEHDYRIHPEEPIDHVTQLSAYCDKLNENLTILQENYEQQQSRFQDRMFQDRVQEMIDKSLASQCGKRDLGGVE